MSYSMKDVDEAAAIVRELRPKTVISRSDYDFGLSVANPESGSAFILFRPARPDIGQSEIVSTLDEVRELCFFMGGQWTAEEAARIAAAARKRYN